MGSQDEYQDLEALDVATSRQEQGTCLQILANPNSSGNILSHGSSGCRIGAEKKGRLEVA